MEVGQGTEQLLHDEGGLFFSQVLFFDDIVEQFASVAVPMGRKRLDILLTKWWGNLLENQEAHVVPFPDLVQFDNVWVVLQQ